MPRGGTRPNSGPKRTRPPVARRLMLELDASEAARLAGLQRSLGLSAAEVMRRGLDALDATLT